MITLKLILYRLYLRYRRNWMTMTELADKPDLTLGELQIIFGAAKMSGLVPKKPA